MMYETLPLLNLNNTTDLFLGVTYQLSSINTTHGRLLLRSEWRKKKSCNKNAIQNTEILENYIGMQYIYNLLTSQYFLLHIYYNFSSFFIHCGVATCHLPFLLMKADTWPQEKDLLHCWGSAKVVVLYIILLINYCSFRWCRPFLHAGVRRVEKTRKSRWPRFLQMNGYVPCVHIKYLGICFLPETSACVSASWKEHDLPLNISDIKQVVWYRTPVFIPWRLHITITYNLPHLRL
jgi:hypothetical protein